MKLVTTSLLLALLLAFVPQVAQSQNHSDKKKIEQIKRSNPFKEKAVKRYVRDSLDVLVARCENVLKAAYMAQEYVATHYDVPGWEGFPVKEYTYYTGKDAKTGKPKKGRVYLLMPTAKQLAYWVISACWKSVHSLSFYHTNLLLKHIKYQSGAQFAVRGVVYEAMYEKDYYKPYIFKDGITVYVADPKMVATDEQLAECTDEQLEFYLHLTDKDIKSYTGRYARICSTTREMYYAWGGTTEVGSSEYLDMCSLSFLPVIRELYKKAYKSKDNELIDAWCNLQMPKYVLGK